MNFYRFTKDFPNFKTSLAEPLPYEVDEKELKFVREKYEQYLDAVPPHEQDILRPFYAEMNDAFVVRMFTINFFNMSYMEQNDTLDTMFQTFARMRKEYGVVTFFQGALPYPEKFEVKEQDLAKDGARMSEIVPKRISQIDAFPKDAEVAVIMLGYLNTNALHCTVFISKETLDEKLLTAMGECIQDEWKKYFLFSKGKKRSIFE